MAVLQERVSRRIRAVVEGDRKPAPVEGGITVERMDDQVVIVTGGAGGIGKAIVSAFAAQGAAVACCYHRSREAAEALADELNAQGGRVLAVKLDVTDSLQIAAAADSIETHFGPITILVNNAGDIVKTVPLNEITEQLWDEVLSLNLRSAFLCAQRCAPSMQSARYGRIINISSLAARAGGGPGSIPYAVSKGGVETLTRGLAKELGPFGITVNAVSPGVIDTDIHRRFAVAGDLVELAQRLPLRRTGTADEVAAAVVFLASRAASYITGEVVAVNGGLRMD